MKQSQTTITFYVYRHLEESGGLFWGGRTYTLGKDAEVTGRYLEKEETDEIAVEVILKRFWFMTKKLWINETMFEMNTITYYNCK